MVFKIGNIEEEVKRLERLGFEVMVRENITKDSYIPVRIVFDETVIINDNFTLESLDKTLRSLYNLFKVLTDK